MSDWDPELYRRFEEERRRPFLDLLAMLPPRVSGRWVDLGCGDGRNTRTAAEALGGTEVLGVDASPAMIEEASRITGPYTWRRDRIEELIAGDDRWDLVLSNAALHWLEDHPRWFATLLERVAPGGWLAVQMPWNHVARSHLLMAAAAEMAPFRDALGGHVHEWPQQRPPFYADRLQAAGFTHTLVQLRTYRHVVPDAEAIVAFTSATGMRPYLERLPADLHEAFRERYQRLVDLAYPPCDAEGTRLFDFTRLFVVGQRPA